MVIRQKCWLSAEYLSPTIELLLPLVPSFLLLPVTVVLFTLIPSLSAEIHSPSLSQEALWRQNWSLFEPYLGDILAHHL